MADDTPPAPPATGDPLSPAHERERRLADALRANLRRRKLAARAPSPDEPQRDG